MVSDVEIYDKIFLSYGKILYRLNKENITRKDGSKITMKDLMQAIHIMLEKHPTCRWRSERMRSKRFYVLVEGYAWLLQVYFQKEKPQLDADIDFFLDRIRQYKELLKLESNRKFGYKEMTISELTKYFEKSKLTVQRGIAKMLVEGYSEYKYHQDGKTVIKVEGVEWLCKNVFKRKYLELLEQYKMELTEKYIEAGYPYDHFF
ncbi:MAG: hypothetical protein FWF46_03465 [Oscillospiraceae bacterium]|nr:hypothetical protein [Oscillospiraceae bacterium]